MSLPFEYERLDRRRVRRHHAHDDRTSNPPASSSCRFRSIARRPTCPAPATARTRSSSPRRTWSCGTRRPETDVHSVGIFTLPEMEFPFGTMDEVVAGDPARRRQRSSSATSSSSCSAASTSITGPVVAAVAARHRGLSVLQIDAHADLRDRFMGTPHNHACAMRRVLDYARCTQVGIRSLSPEEAAAAPTLPTEIFYDFNMRRDPDWIDRVVDSLERDGLHHDRRRRLRPGDHAGHRHAGARRPVLVRRRWRCCGG